MFILSHLLRGKSIYYYYYYYYYYCSSNDRPIHFLDNMKFIFIKAVFICK
jgi:hypothetical protein